MRIPRFFSIKIGKIAKKTKIAKIAKMAEKAENVNVAQKSRFGAFCDDFGPFWTIF